MDFKIVVIVSLAIACVLELGIIIVKKPACGGEINVHNASCTHSENIGRRIFLHICEKDGEKVYDLRRFWRDDSDYLKPSINGVQLLQIEFDKLCKQCSN